MRVRIFLVVAVLNIGIVFSQDDEPKNASQNIATNYFSASVSTRFFAAGSRSGLLLSLDFAYNSNENIFKLAGSLGSDLNICAFGSCLSEDVYTIDLLYGRKFKIANFLSLEPYAGVGFVNYSAIVRDPLRNEITNTLGIPLEGRIRFIPGSVFNLGLVGATNINSARNFSTVGIFFQINLVPRNE